MAAMTESFNFLEPWKEERSEIYKNELYKELSSSHMLKGEKISIVARRIDCDEVLFKLLNKPQKYAQVRLTWSGKPEKILNGQGQKYMTH